MEKVLLAKFAKIISRERLPDRMLFSGYFQTDDPKKISLGRVFYFIEIIAPWFPNSQVVNSIIKTLTDIYYQQSSLDVALNLEITLRAVNSRLAELSKEGDSDWVNKLNGVIGVIKNDEIHFSQVGGLSGYLFRDEKIIQITENQGLKREISPLKVFEQLTSGKLEAGDKMILANNNLFNYISLDRTKNCFRGAQLEVCLEEVFCQLKKIKAKEVNVVAVEVNTEDDYSKLPLSNCPDVFYLDQPLDSGLVKVSRFLKPIGSKITSTSQLIFHHSKKGYHKVKRFSKEKLSPKMSVLAYKSKELAKGGLSKANQTIMPKLKSLNQRQPLVKIKSVTVPYYSKSSRLTSGFYRFASNFWRSIVRLATGPWRQYLYIGLAILILFVAFLKVRANNSKQADLKAQQQIADSYDSAAKKFEDGKNDIGLKRQEQGMTELVDALVLAQKAKDSKYNAEAANQLYNQIQAELDKQNKVSRLTQVDIFASINYQISKILYMGDSIYAIGASGQITSVNAKTKEQKLEASLPATAGELATATAASNGNSLFLLTKSSRMYQYSTSDKSVTERKIVDLSGKWESTLAIGEFAGNIYVLDGEAGIVWKHTPSDEGFSQGKDYLDTRTVSIKGAVDLAIDGEIFVLLSDGSVKRFSKGAPVDFVLKALPDAKPVSSVKKIASSGVSGDLLLLASDQNRVVRYALSGDFVAQFSTSLGDITSVAANQKSLKVWFSIGDKIYLGSL